MLSKKIQKTAESGFFWKKDLVLMLEKGLAVMQNEIPLVQNVGIAIYIWSIIFTVQKRSEDPHASI